MSFWLFRSSDSDLMFWWKTWLLQNTYSGFPSTSNCCWLPTLHKYLKPIWTMLLRFLRSYVVCDWQNCLRKNAFSDLSSLTDLPTGTHYAIEMESADKCSGLANTHLYLCTGLMQRRAHEALSVSVWSCSCCTRGVDLTPVFWNNSEAWGVPLLVEELVNKIPARHLMGEKDVVIKIHRKGLKYYSKSEIQRNMYLSIYFCVQSSQLTSKMGLNVVALILAPVWSSA